MPSCRRRAGVAMGDLGATPPMPSARALTAQETTRAAGQSHASTGSRWRHCGILRLAALARPEGPAPEKLSSGFHRLDPL